jgi:hypothetical protein
MFIHEGKTADEARGKDKNLVPAIYGKPGKGPQGSGPGRMLSQQ